MWLILPFFIGFTVLFGGTYGSDLRITMESVNITYINTDFGYYTLELVRISKLTNKVRGTVRYYIQPTDKLMVTATIFKLGSNNKAYKFSQITRSLKSAMLLGESAPFGQAILPSITPSLYWPPQTNVTYILHDYWIPKSKVPVNDLPIPIITGRFKGLAVGKYPNNTILIKVEAVIKVFYSDEDFD